MDNNSKLITNIESKMNLNYLYTKKEIEEIKKIIPKIKPLINSNINKMDKNSNLSHESKNIIEDNINQYIDKNKFIELILEKTKNIFKQENNIIFSKSISFILEEIQKIKNEAKKKKKIENNNLTKNSLSINLNTKIKINSKNINLHKRSPDKNSFFIKLNRGKGLFSPKSSRSDKSNDFIPFSPYNKTFNNNLNNNNINNSKYKKLIDFTYDNEYKIKHIKGNSIINNFITFSNHSIDNNSNININNNIENDLNNFKNKIKLNKNGIYSIHYINNNKRLNASNKTYSNQEKKIIPQEFHIIELNNNLKRHISPSNNFPKYRNTEKYLFHVKEKFSDYDLERNLNKSNNNYLSNYFKKIEKLKNVNNPDYNNNKNKKHFKAHQSTYKLSYNPSKKIINKNEININWPSYSKIENKDFDIFDFDNNVGKQNTLLLIGNYIFNKFSFSSVIKLDKYNNWCKKIASGYTRKNPYHHDIHAADVAQTSFIYLLYGKIINKTKFNKVSICSIIISCLCHDFKHPGINNNFLKETKNELAIRYNDISILENMHISETFKLINQNQDCNIFSGMNPKIYKEIRKQMISCVLSTDMAYHSRHVDFLKIITGKNHNIENNNNNIDENQKYMNLIVHTADISNPTKQFNIYIKWAKLIFEEFCQQGDKEKALGLPCSYDRKKIKLNSNQISFIDYVVESFISLYVTVFPDLQFLYDNLINNREKFSNYEEDSIIKNNTTKNKNLSNQKNL